MDRVSRQTQLLRLLPDFSIFLVLLAVVIIVMVTQNRVVGWEPGYDELQPGHHGWVSSHTLAIIKNATPNNFFVGYARATMNDQGDKDYEYFDRYPIFFSASMNFILSLKSKLSTQIYLAKQVMNLIFILTIIVAFLLVNKISGRRILSLAVSMLSVSSQYLLFYKDMIHFDQPALLGFLFLIYAIAVYKIDGKRWFVYLAAIATVCMGRGYASYSVLSIWFIIEAFGQIRIKGVPFRQKIRNIVLHDSFRILLVAVTWGILCLLYNMSVEAWKRDVPLIQSSIMQSAINRLGFDEDLKEAYPYLLNWNYFLSDQMIRMVRWSFPLWKYKGSLLQNSAILTLVFFIIYLFARSLDAARRDIIIIMSTSGILWLFGMRNLSAFHDYTAMYYLGIPLALYTALISFLKLPKRADFLLLILSLTIFTYRDLKTQELHYENGRIYNAFTYDFIEIASRIPGEGKVIHLEDGIPFAPYGPGFYLPSHFLSSMEAADYVISADRDFLPSNLTRDNSRMFLFEK